MRNKSCFHEIVNHLLSTEVLDNMMYPEAMDKAALGIKKQMELWLMCCTWLSEHISEMILCEQLHLLD